MIDDEYYNQIKKEVEERIEADRALLDELRAEIQPLKNKVKKIQQRRVTSVSIVGTDGGNNRFEFDPFMVHIIRVVDSSNNTYCLNAITPTTDVDELSNAQFDTNGEPKTPLGIMMGLLEVSNLTALSHMIRKNKGNQPTSPTWVQVYRELVEWATLLFLVVNKDFGSVARNSRPTKTQPSVPWKRIPKPLRSLNGSARLRAVLVFMWIILTPLA